MLQSFSIRRSIPSSPTNADKPTVMPVFIRLPQPPDVCPYTQLPRAALRSLTEPSAANGWQPLVRSHLLTARGATRGIRLICLRSLLAHLGGTAADAVTVEPALPPFIRLPRPKSRCAVTGLSRSTIAELCVPSVVNEFAPPVYSRDVRTRGRQRGIRIVDTCALVSFIRSFSASADLQEGKEAA